MTEKEIEQKLNELADLNPNPAATAHALEKTRAALAAPMPAPPRRRTRSVIRYAIWSAALLFLAMIGGWLLAPPRLAFADVTDKVARTHSVSLTVTTEIDGKSRIEKGFALSDGRIRMESPDGNYTIIDPNSRRSLAVNPKEKRALLIRGYHNRLPPNIYEVFRGIRKEEVRKLPAETVDGKSVEVFLAKLKSPESEQEVKVFVDPKTRLPMRLEMSHQNEKTKKLERSVIDLAFDRPIDEALFSTEPPARYAVQVEGTDAPLPARNENPAALVVIPKEGLGSVKFGMSKQEVIDRLGEPDKIDQRGTGLDYSSRGFAVMVSPIRGVRLLTFYTQKTIIVKINDFAGKTKEGIGMGSTAAEIIKAYGEPEAKETEEITTRLNYRKSLGMEFTLFNDKLVMFSISAVK